MFQCIECGKIYLQHPDAKCECGGFEFAQRDDPKQEVIHCMLCNTTQPVKQDGSNECDHCGNRFMLTNKQAGHADAWPEQLKDAVYAKRKADKRKAVLDTRIKCEACGEPLKEGAETEGDTCSCGEIYMPEAANKLIPQDKSSVDQIPDEIEDPEGYSESIANPFVPYSGNNPEVLLVRERNKEQMDKKTFDEEKEDEDMSQPENNELIPQTEKKVQI